VAIGDYYYDDKMKSIEKRYNKIKRGETSKSRSSIGRVVEWKVRPNPEEIVVRVASALHTFAGLNASYFLEVTNALSTANTIITELKIALKNVKYQHTLEFEKTMKVVDILNMQQLNKALQMQRDDMNVEFERKI